MGLYIDLDSAVYDHPEAAKELAALRERAEKAEAELAYLRATTDHGPAVSTLPDCMMPDGDSPCAGYSDLRRKAEMMATALHRIGEVTLVPGNWSVSDWPSLNGMVAAVRRLDHWANAKPEQEAGNDDQG